MPRTNYIATPAKLLRALLNNARLNRPGQNTSTTPVRKMSEVPPTMRSSVEDVSPFTLREGLFYELLAG